MHSSSAQLAPDVHAIRPHPKYEVIRTPIDVNLVRCLLLRAPPVGLSEQPETLAMLLDKIPSVNAVNRVATLAQALKRLGESDARCAELLQAGDFGTSMREELRSRAEPSRGPIPPLVLPAQLLPERERSHA